VCIIAEVTQLNPDGSSGYGGVLISGSHQGIRASHVDHGKQPRDDVFPMGVCGGHDDLLK
jgi:hypothetical protein